MKRLLRQVVILVAVAAAPALVSAWMCWKQGKWDGYRDHTIAVSDAAHWKEQVFWVDARSSVDFLASHVPGAVRLTEDDWNELLPELLKAWEPSGIVVVYCNSHNCHSSDEVAKRLREEVGLMPVYVLRGGWEAWKGAQR